jgi:hypothetical protein
MTLTTPGGARIPARLLHEGGSGKVLLLNAGDSAVAASARSAATVLAIDLFQTGAARDTRPRDERHFLTFNAADVVCQVQDVLAAAEWLAGRPGGGPVEVLSDGDAVLPHLIAQALAPPGLMRTPARMPFIGQQAEGSFAIPGFSFAGGLAVIRELRGRTL